MIVYSYPDSADWLEWADSLIHKAAVADEPTNPDALLRLGQAMALLSIAYNLECLVQRGNEDRGGKNSDD